MPECDAFIVNAWQDLGRRGKGKDGAERLTYQEVKAYSDCVCELEPFDILMIVKMSQDYISEQELATEEYSRLCYLENTAEGYAEIRKHKQDEVSQKMRQLASAAK